MICSVNCDLAWINFNHYVSGLLINDSFAIQTSCLPLLIRLVQSWVHTFYSIIPSKVNTNKKNHQHSTHHHEIIMITNLVPASLELTYICTLSPSQSPLNNETKRLVTMSCQSFVYQSSNLICQIQILLDQK